MQLYAYAFSGYALVNVALGDEVFAAEALPSLDGLVERMRAPAIAKTFGPERVELAGRSLSKSVAQRGHLALLLTARHAVKPLDPERASLLDALVDGLAADALASRSHLLPTYGRRTWPADNEVLAAALALYAARVRKSEPAERASRALRASLASLEAAGLPPSAVKPGTLEGADVPRGCALSWTIAMRGLYDGASARALYGRYRQTYWTSAGPLGGFREWPPGVERAADIDSGPIVLGVGAAATALGIGAARLAGRSDDVGALSATAEAAGGGPAGGGKALERAILLWAQTARPWL